MVEQTKWQVKSNGLNFIVFDPEDDFRTVAECRRKEDADRICALSNNGLACFRCRDGYTPLYCLNCAEDIHNKRVTVLDNLLAKCRAVLFQAECAFQGNPADQTPAMFAVRELITELDGGRHA